MHSNIPSTDQTSKESLEKQELEQEIAHLKWGWLTPTALLGLLAIAGTSLSYIYGEIKQQTEVQKRLREAESLEKQVNEQRRLLVETQQELLLTKASTQVALQNLQLANTSLEAARKNELALNERIKAERVLAANGEPIQRFRNANGETAAYIALHDYDAGGNIHRSLAHILAGEHVDSIRIYLPPFKDAVKNFVELIAGHSVRSVDIATDFDEASIRELSRLHGIAELKINVPTYDMFVESRYVKLIGNGPRFVGESADGARAQGRCNYSHNSVRQLISELGDCKVTYGPPDLNYFIDHYSKLGNQKSNDSEIVSLALRDSAIINSQTWIGVGDILSVDLRCTDTVGANYERLLEANVVKELTVLQDQITAEDAGKLSGSSIMALTIDSTMSDNLTSLEVLCAALKGSESLTRLTIIGNVSQHCLQNIKAIGTLEELVLESAVLTAETVNLLNQMSSIQTLRIVRWRGETTNDEALVAQIRHSGLNVVLKDIPTEQ